MICKERRFEKEYFNRILYVYIKHCQHDLGMFFERILNEVMRIRSKSFHDRIKVTNVHPPTGIENEKMHNI